MNAVQVRGAEQRDGGGRLNNSAGVQLGKEGWEKGMGVVWFIHFVRKEDRKKYRDKYREKQKGREIEEFYTYLFIINAASVVIHTIPNQERSNCNLKNYYLLLIYVFSMIPT